MKSIIYSILTLALSSSLTAQVSLGTNVINESAVLKMGNGTDNKGFILPIVTDLTAFANDTANNKPGMMFYDNSEKCIKFTKGDNSVSQCILTEDQISTPSAQESTAGSFNVNSVTSYTNVVTPITVAKSDVLDRTTLISFTTTREIRNGSSSCAKIFVRLRRERTDSSNNTVSTVLREYEMDNAVTLANSTLEHPLSFTYYDENPAGFVQKYYLEARRDSGCSVSTNLLTGNDFNLIAY